MKSLIKEFYATLQPSPKQTKTEYDSYRIKPSSLGTKCMRKLYYDMYKVPVDFDVPADVKKMGAMGDGISHILSNKFRDQGFLVDYYEPRKKYQKGFDGTPNLEFPIECPELGIKKGYIDAVFIFDKLWLGEYKSATTRSFQKLQAPKPEHLIQGVEYLFVFNKLLSEGRYKHIKELKGFDRAEGIIFLYVDRDNAVHFNMKEYPITIEAGMETFKHIVQKSTTAMKYADNKELPPKTPDWCNSCPWRAKCSKDFNIK